MTVSLYLMRHGETEARQLGQRIQEISFAQVFCSSLIHGHEFLDGSSLFVHQYSHQWIDFRGIQDVFKLQEHYVDIRKHGLDMPKIRNGKWTN